MKKGLIGLLIVSFILVFAASAMAKLNFSWKAQAKIDLQSRTDKANGASYLGCPSNFLECKVSGTTGPWTGVAIATSMYDREMAEAPGLSKFGTPFAIRVKTFIVYQGERFKLIFDPTGMAPDTLISEVQEGVFKTGVPIRIPARPGVCLEIPMNGITPYFMYNNRYVKTAVLNCGPVTVEEVWSNFLAAAKFKSGPFSLDVRYAVGGEKDQYSYGASIGAYGKWKVKPVELKIQYMSWSPQAANLKYNVAGAATYFRFKYWLPAGMPLNSFYFEWYHRDKEVYLKPKAYNCYKLKGYIYPTKDVEIGVYVYSYDKAGTQSTRFKVNLIKRFK